VTHHVTPSSRERRQAGRAAVKRSAAEARAAEAEARAAERTADELTALTVRSAEQLAARCGAEHELSGESRALKQQLAELHGAVHDAAVKAQLAREHAQASYRDLELAHRKLIDSYYLSGAEKKIDIRDIPRFGDVARLVKAEGRLGMNFDRLYTLWQAVERAPDAAAIVEVGVYKGGSAKFICEALQSLGRTPTFYVCDTFSGHAVVNAELDPLHSSTAKFMDTSPESVTAYLAGYSNVRLVAGDIRETSRQLTHEPEFAFVHIDVDVYPATDFCLRFFGPRLADGAMLIVDDYGFLTCPGAKKAVDDFVAENPDFVFLHLLTGQALLIRAHR
jgi:hypothetical protein